MLLYILSKNNSDNIILFQVLSMTRNSKGCSKEIGKKELQVSKLYSSSIDRYSKIHTPKLTRTQCRPLPLI